MWRKPLFKGSVLKLVRAMWAVVVEAGDRAGNVEGAEAAEGGGVVVVELGRRNMANGGLPTRMRGRCCPR
jgi:hypothetical protein